MIRFKSYKDESRCNWGLHLEEGVELSDEKLTLGAILRIADAVEAMAKNHVKLQDDYDYMKRSRDNYRQENDKMHKQIAAYKGHIKRLKNKS